MKSFSYSSLLLFTLCADAQIESEAVLEEIVVTVTRSKESEFDKPYSIQVIDSKTLSQELVRSLPEALVKVPGVTVQKTANGQGSPFIRGFTGYRTLALIDGIRYNNSVYRDGPNEYFSLIDFNSLQQLELLNGPASSAYGSDAIGGALNLQSKTANASAEAQGKYFISGRQSYRYSGAENSHLSRTELALGEGGEWGLLLGYSLKNFGDIKAAELGELPHTGYDESAWDARFDGELSDDWSLTLVHQGLQQDDVWRTHSTVFSRSFAGTQVGSDLRRLKDQRRSLSYVRLSGVDQDSWYDRATLTVSRQAWDEDGERVRGSGRALTESFDSRMLGAELQLASDLNLGELGFGKLGLGELVYGVDFYRDNVGSGRTDLNADGSVDRVRIQGAIGDDSRYDLLGVYVQAMLPVSDRLSLTVASRYSYTRAQVGRFEDPVTGLPASFQNSWSALASSIRFSYELTDDSSWKLWAGLSQSFRAPNIADLSRFGGSRSNETEIAATGLAPEKFLTGEIGIRAQQDGYNFSASYYHTDISDFITSTPTGRVVDGLTEVSKQNSSRGYVEGIEFSAQLKLGGGFTATGNITWLRGDLDVFTAIGSNSAVTEPFSRITPVTANAGLRWDSGDGNYWLSCNATIAAKADRLSLADQQDLQRIPPGGTPGYTLINLQAGSEINDHLSATLGIGNVLDEAYRSHGSGSNEPGRGIKLGLQARF